MPGITPCSALFSTFLLFSTYDVGGLIHVASNLTFSLIAAKDSNKGQVGYLRLLVSI